MFLLLNIVTLLIASSLGATGSLSRLKLLKFAPNSYIQFSPDWSPLMSAISVCGWIRDVGSAPHRAFFSDHSSNVNELTILADGSYIGIFGSYQHLQSKFSVPKGTWYLACITWSASSRAHRYYVNGQELGSQQTPSGRSLRTGGALVLGKWIGTSSNNDFGGEMAYLNVYAKELSASEVARMAQQGMCSNIAAVDEHESSRLIKWEELVKLGRRGTVTDVYLEECVQTMFENTANLKEAERTLNATAEELKETLAEKEEMEKELEDVSTKLEESERKRNETAEELKDTRQELEETLAEKDKMEQELEDVSTKLNATLAELEETQAEKDKTEEEIEDVSTKLNATLAELEETKVEKDKTEEELGDVSTKLNATLAELEETKAEKDKTEEELEDVWTKLNATLAELDEISTNLNRTWDWKVFLSEQFLNKTFSTEHSQLIRSSWDGIAEALVGIRITDQFIKLLSQVDRVEDRPWSMLYSQIYFNKLFTQEMADRLTSIWDGISDKLVGVTMTKEVIELLNHVTDKTNCGN